MRVILGNAHAPWAQAWDGINISQSSSGLKLLLCCPSPPGPAPSQLLSLGWMNHSSGLNELFLSGYTSYAETGTSTLWPAKLEVKQDWSYNGSAVYPEQLGCRDPQSTFKMQHNFGFYSHLFSCRLSQRFIKVRLLWVCKQIFMNMRQKQSEIS